MFFDHAKIYIKAGDGGDGMVSFYTEKYVTNGGPDGGDGGRGGDVVFYATEGLSTLQSFRFKRKFAAENGEKGMNRKMYGRSAGPLRVAVPVGTYITNLETGVVVADFTENGQEIVIAKGGQGGKGNIHFANSVRQAPNFARAGMPGDEAEFQVELKLIADVGLLGFPSVGKSTLLSVVSAARPKIADYHFTTLEPNLGVVAVGDSSFVMADIPGIIEGASDGAGLGHDFLRHIERTRLLLHIVDVSGCEGRDPIEDVRLINQELVEFNPVLAARPQFLVGNKMDQASEEQMDALRALGEELSCPVFFMSAAIADGTQELMNAVAAELPKLPKVILLKEAPTETVYRFKPEELFKIVVEDGVFDVQGSWIQNLVASTNFDDPDSLMYFQRILRKRGVIDELKKLGVKDGDPVKMYDLEFDYLD